MDALLPHVERIGELAGGTLANDFERGISIVKDRKVIATRAKEAESAFRAVVKADPNHHLAWYNLGLLAERRGDHKTARDAWKRALSADGSYLAARARLAELELLKPMQANYTTPEGEKRTLQGFFTVDREKLKALKAEQANWESLFWL